MPRRPRAEGPGAVHHVVPQGNNRSRIVHDDSDRLAFMREIATVSQKRGWVRHSECLMDTHYHAVVETAEPDLGIGMGLALGRYATHFNYRHRREGHLFRRRFWSVRIETGRHFVCACLYVLLNPLAAGLCSHPREWPWSSYNELVDMTRPTQSQLPVALAGDEETGRRRLAELMDEAVGRARAEQAHDARSAWDAVEAAVDASGWVRDTDAP